MDTIQLTLILRKDKYTSGAFQGVYPSDKLPTSVSFYPALFIANVDTSDKPGSHWIAFYFTKDQEGEFSPMPPYKNTLEAHSVQVFAVHTNSKKIRLNPTIQSPFTI